jgi:uncharacterized nucleotidyltransferase DUF6036
VKLDQFHHVIRAAAAITGETLFVVVGSQAILAQFNDAPSALLRSEELHLYPKNRPDLADLIDGSIGRDSLFHSTFGYHADGVGPETAKFPSDLETRALRVQSAATGNATAICPNVHDLVVSKLIAGRPKDLEWIGHVFQYGLASATEIPALLDKVACDPQTLQTARNRLAVLAKATKPKGKAPKID